MLNAIYMTKNLGSLTCKIFNSENVFSCIEKFEIASQCCHINHPMIFLRDPAHSSGVCWECFQGGCIKLRRILHFLKDFCGTPFLVQIRLSIRPTKEKTDSRE